MAGVDWEEMGKIERNRKCGRSNQNGGGKGQKKNWRKVG